MNRHLSQVGSNYLPKDRQGETAYRHILGVYELLKWFWEKIQYSSMMGYPASTMSCHVSDHKACEDARELKYRYELHEGISVQSDDSNNNSCMWYLVKMNENSSNKKNNFKQ